MKIQYLALPVTIISLLLLFAIREDSKATSMHLQDNFVLNPAISTAPNEDSWTKFYDFRFADFGDQIEKTNDGGYIVAGTIDNGAGYDPDVIVMKLASNGDIEWQREYSGDEYTLTFRIQIHSLKETSTGDFILAIGPDHPSGYGPELQKGWLLKINSTGEVLWHKSFNSNNQHSWFAEAVLDDDDSVIVVGFTLISNSRYDGWIVKVDKDGEIVWQKTYDFSYIDDELDEIITDDFFYALDQTVEGYFVGGWVREFNDTTNVNYGSDYSVTHIDFDGNVLWRKSYALSNPSDSSPDEFLRAIEAMKDGGLIVAGYGKYTDLSYDTTWILKLDSVGNVVWQKTYPIELSGISIRAIKETENGSFLAIGYTLTGSQHAWIINFSSVGSIIYTKAYSEWNTQFDEFRDLELFDDGSFILVGQMNRSSSLEWDILVMKQNSEGTFDACGLESNDAPVIMPPEEPNYFNFESTQFNVNSPTIDIVDITSASVSEGTGLISAACPVYSIFGYVVDVFNDPLENVQIAALGGGGSDLTDSEGYYEISDLPPGDYILYATKTDYEFFPEPAIISISESLSLNFKESGFLLPYPGGTSRTLTGINNDDEFDHHKTGSSTEYAFDWSKGDGIVVASQDGIVRRVKDNSSIGGCDPAYGSAGNFIVIGHADGTESFYLHLAKNSAQVAEGNEVKSGQPIGRIGPTGYFCGEHLHYHVRYAIGNNFSIPTSFEDITENDGVPNNRGQDYLSGNDFEANRPLLGFASSNKYNYPPIGHVSFRLTGQASHILQLSAFDYEIEPIFMRIANSEADLENAPWEDFQSEVEWLETEAWVQFKDDSGKLSEIYSDSLELSAYEPASAEFSVEGKMCSSEPLLVTNLSALTCPQCGWKWEMGNGTISTNEVPQSEIEFYPDFYYEPGTYNLSLTAYSAVDNDTSTQVINVLESPNPVFSLQVLDETTVVVTALESFAQNWEWDFGDGDFISGQEVTYTYEHPFSSSDYIELKVTGNNGCSNSSYKFPAEYFSQLYLPLITK